MVETKRKTWFRKKKMEKRPLIKWHAQELIRLLSDDLNDQRAARIVIDLETHFVNSLPYREIEAKAPEEDT